MSLDSATKLSVPEDIDLVHATAWSWDAWRISNNLGQILGDPLLCLVWKLEAFSDSNFLDANIIEELKLNIEEYTSWIEKILLEIDSTYKSGWGFGDNVLNQQVKHMRWNVMATCQWLLRNYQVIEKRLWKDYVVATIGMCIANLKFFHLCRMKDSIASDEDFCKIITDIANSGGLDLEIKGDISNIKSYDIILTLLQEIITNYTKYADFSNTWKDNFELILEAETFSIHQCNRISQKPRWMSWGTGTLIQKSIMDKKIGATMNISLSDSFYGIEISNIPYSLELDS